MSLRLRGFSNVQFLPFGWDPEVMPFQSERPQGTWPGALFIGNWDQEREEFLNEVAAHLPLRIYGTAYWGQRTRRKSRARRCWQGGPLIMTDAARAIREAAISLNLLRTQHMVDGEHDGVIMRHFEVPGAGGFLLSTRSETATDLFPAGSSGEYFCDVQECIEKCKYFVAKNDERRAICNRGHKLVAEKHRYIHRACEVLIHLDNAA